MSQRSPLGIARVVVVYLFVAALVWISQPTPLLVAIGLPFVVTGEAVRFWAAGHLLKSKELAVSGPYRYTQNPLYLGRFLILTGFCLMAYLPVRVSGIAIPGTFWSSRSATASFFYPAPQGPIEGSRLAELTAGPGAVPTASVILPRLAARDERPCAGHRPHEAQPEHWMPRGVAAVAVCSVKGRAGRQRRLRPARGVTLRWQLASSSEIALDSDATRRAPGTAALSVI